MNKLSIAQFEDFWKKCPRKVGKGAARRKFEIALRKISFKKLLSAMIDYARSVRGKTKSFIPHPATWLHQERWDDELEEPEFDPIEYLNRKREEEGELL